MTYFDMLLNLIVFLIFFFSCYKFSLSVLNALVFVWFKYEHKLVLYPFEIVNDLFAELFRYGIITLVLPIVYDQTVFDRLLKFSVMVIIFVFHFISTPDRNDLLKENALDIGYGAALWHYKNYLHQIELHSRFVERINNFESQNDVKVLQKLFLLVPDSCVVPETIDFEDEKDSIERCQELEPFQKTTAGIKGRIYNHTVYLLRTRLGNKRMVLEYAQPCKGLSAFKSKNIITEEEMARQRQLFVSFLQTFLHDEHDSYKYCEIVEFNDKKQKVSDALIQHCCF